MGIIFVIFGVYKRENVTERQITGATSQYVNPTSKFVIGSPNGDAGLTGYKDIIGTFN